MLAERGVVCGSGSLSQQFLLYNDVSRRNSGGVSRDRLGALGRNSTVITFHAQKGCKRLPACWHGQRASGISIEWKAAARCGDAEAQPGAYLSRYPGVL